ncbi:GNAT family N-acetyltransferase [Actibacterium mucosum]|uniref:GNAT family N-acetyltransferase n=1 Tax=Actibacterium mucosum TaxID=1087332 RepID=UPI001376B048|nr:GNAT family N-acetyltransferase [Actibacterium mucosum]
MNGAAAFYSDEQRRAWAGPHTVAPDHWEARLLAGTCRVAVDDTGQMVGFFTMGDDGYLDFAYVSPAWMGSGLARTLLSEVEDAARQKGQFLLSTEASFLAQRFLLRHGWKTVASQHVIRDSVAIPNFRMQKQLTA